MQKEFNNYLRQIILLGFIFLLGILFIKTLYVFLPGLLGGITLYILTRKIYMKLTITKKWSEWATSLLFVTVCILIIAIPTYFAVRLVTPKITLIVNNQKEIINSLDQFSKRIETFTGTELFTPANVEATVKSVSGYIPSLLNSTAMVVTNFCLVFFFLYYLLYNGLSIEKYLRQNVPLDSENIKQLAEETDIMIRANALGIPIVSIVHGVVAAIGFLLLGIHEWGVLAFLTGVFAFFPFVGIMVVWVPMVIYLYSIHENYTATGVALYSILITGNVDYITRLGLLKKLGNVHPIITVFGVILGLELFGFMGLIFGPLLISYFILLIRFYINEFTSTKLPIIKPHIK